MQKTGACKTNTFCYNRLISFSSLLLSQGFGVSRAPEAFKVLKLLCLSGGIAHIASRV